jgi:hypothetical protein
VDAAKNAAVTHTNELIFFIFKSPLKKIKTLYEKTKGLFYCCKKYIFSFLTNKLFGSVSNYIHK